MLFKKKKGVLAFYVIIIISVALWSLNMTGISFMESISRTIYNPTTTVTLTGFS